ncbi:hypothetical protein SESBI_20440 [Sesbania bispinosa]|nr:hypothetical protein SESBI_20440 [Sesbania bispinosa]
MLCFSNGSRYMAESEYLYPNKLASKGRELEAFELHALFGVFFFSAMTSYYLSCIDTAISNEFNDLEQQRISIQEQKKALQKIEQDKLRTQMIISMYASVTNIVPNLDDQSKISGCILLLCSVLSFPSFLPFSGIVEKDKNAVEKFEYDTSRMTSLDICYDIWKTISS